MPTNLRETLAARVRELECTRASLATDPACYQVGWEDMGFAVLKLIAESPELAAVDWRLANDPPIGEPQKWTRDVVAVTNAGRACAVAYMHGDNGRPGVWQRLASFERREGVICWRPMPGEVLECSHSAELTALRAENERLRVDAERYRFLQTPDGANVYKSAWSGLIYNFANRLSEMVDAARGKGE